MLQTIHRLLIRPQCFRLGRHSPVGISTRGFSTPSQGAHNNAAENGIQIFGDLAITKGEVYITNSKGEEVMVDKTFVFRRCSDGNLWFCVHKSSLPFDPVGK